MHQELNTEGIDFSGFLHYMKEPGTSSDNASISRVFTQLGVNDMMLEYVMNIIPVANFIRTRYQAKPTDLNTLLALPSESFGHQWATFMQANHLNPHFFENLQEHDDRSYLINRLHDTHDMWHIILDFDTSEAGEAGMNAFTYAQSGSPTTCMLMAAKLVRAIGGSDENRFQMMTNICRGYQLGMTAQPFLAIAWEENWTTKLSDLRKLAGIKP